MSKKKKTLEELLEEALVPKDEQPYEVPSNWVWTNIDTVALEIKNGTTIKQNKDEIGYRVTRIESVQNNKIDLTRLGYIHEKELVKEKDYYQANDIALSHINSIEHVGKTALIEEAYLPLIHGMNLLRIRTFKEAILPQYVQYFMRCNQFRKDIRDRINRAVNQVSLNQKNLKQIPIPLAPLNEQKRIAEKVERLLSKIDEAKQLIEEAKETFELRRSAILDKAFHGELTEKWRAEKTITSSADEWVRQIELLKAGTKSKFKDQLDSRISESLYELPERWKWVRLNDLIEASTYGTSAKTNDDRTGMPVLRMGNIVDGNLELENLKYLPTDHPDVLKYDLEENDLLFNRTNSYELVGKTTIASKEVAGRYTFASYLIKISLFYKDILGSYISHYINSYLGRKMLLSMVTQQVGQANINSQKLASLPVPLPPQEEVVEITNWLDHYRELEKKQKEMISIENTIEVLKQSILSKAFRGKLGTNDPTEESAIELLKEVLSEQLS